MAQIKTSPAFEQAHAGLAARLGGIAPSLLPKRDVLLCDVAERDCSPPAGAVRLFVSRGDKSGCTKPDVFTYGDASSEESFARLIVRIASLSGNRAIAADPQSLSVFALAARLADTDVPVLVTGPTGTGKEVLARFVHETSPRRAQAFVAVNCAAIPETMLEALLFGHQKGAFTGASSGGVGLFREADGGTLLLDEIAEMPLSLQAKLLRALQEGEVMPVGATRPVSVDVRIVACANRDLPAEVSAGRFREDLYYRLNVFPLHLAPLRERPGDIPPLAFAMLARHGGKTEPGLTSAALDRLCAHA